jgi:hypothetical protein
MMCLSFGVMLRCLKCLTHFIRFHVLIGPLSILIRIWLSLITCPVTILTEVPPLQKTWRVGKEESIPWPTRVARGPKLALVVPSGRGQLCVRGGLVMMPSNQSSGFSPILKFVL